jgi:hypothetical protein
MGTRGRTCPLAYRYRPEDLAGPATVATPTLFVVGGVYGNVAALRAVLARVAREEPDAAVVFNGDFHYLDTGADAFATVGRTVAGHLAIQGNIEAELAATASGGGDEAGCGCAYPDYVDDATVERSNDVMAELRRTAGRSPELVAPLAALPRYLTVEVGGYRVGIVHGDPENLAGWGLALEAMEPGDEQVRARTGWYGTPTDASTVAGWFRRSGVRALASTHTGLPYAQDVDVDGVRHLVVNNGAAGLPGFAGRLHGVMTRLSAVSGVPSDSLYGTTLEGLRCDALPVDYDTGAWTAQFLAAWPPGSAAHASYYERLTAGTGLGLTQAARGSVTVNAGGVLPRSP